MKNIPFGILFILILLGGASAACAGIVNQGNDAVQIEFQKKDGLSESATLFPGQSLQTPPDAVALRVAPRGSGARGDESIRIRVSEASGKEGVMTKLNQVYRLGVGEEAEARVVLKNGRMTNEGNIALDVALKRKGGLSSRIVLYLDQTVTFPKDTYEVEVLTLKRLRGDELVRVSVMMPDGVVYNITSLGGIARILPENMSSLDDL